ncbi:unnamed protein product [Parascedosporium putredinis]|uniref:Yeast cell wall synthesis Kre9/Knh1-like N-terminal domain-containing protein n=1 Tax=Parascedosporium putredinis TaxID=1442378 RepID=A0A9P1HCZ3_9PEZI|nr:unnamed protein product [Parascedosporium putredinis]CAI8005150.1 unnamed protein product [Parascedosporium putredinis]
MDRLCRLPPPLFFLLHAFLAHAGVVVKRDTIGGTDAGSNGTFAAITFPGKDATLVTGTTVEVTWERGDDGPQWDGKVMMEVAEASSTPFTSFVYVDYDIPYASEAHNWTIPERLNPGSYAIRIVNSSQPATFSDSPIFTVIHAAPVPTEAPAPPSSSRKGLTSDDIIGLATGLSVAALVAALAVWAWRHSKNRERRGIQGSAARAVSENGRLLEGAVAMSPSTMVETGSAAGEEGMADLDKLPEGVISGWAPEGIRVDPIELPAEVYKRWSDDTRERGLVGIGERLELSGSRGRDGTGNPEVPTEPQALGSSETPDRILNE